MSDERLTPVELCERCMRGEGGECHTPGCALWMNRAPDIPVSPIPALGKLVPPYPYDHCANADCERPLKDESDAAYLFTDQDSGKLIMFCDDCARHVELNAPLRFKLVAL